MWIADVDIKPESSAIIRLDHPRLRNWLKGAFTPGVITSIIGLKRTPDCITATVTFSAIGSDADRALLMEHRDDQQLIMAYLESCFLGAGACDAENIQSLPTERFATTRA